jgi:hypothetical protein
MPTQNDPKTYRSALQNLLCCRPVAYYPSLARAVGGVRAALMLSQLLYWSSTKSGSEFYKSVQELIDETGLSIDEQATARKQLIQCGAIRARRQGWPATWHYQPDLDRISELLSGIQIRTLPESDDARLLQRQTLTTPESDDARIRRRKNHVKSGNRFGGKPNLTEGAINELNTENTTENTNQEEEGAQPQNFSNLDDQIIGELLNFGVFQSKLAEIDQAGWTPDQLRELMVTCRRDDRRGTPAALLLTRIHEMRPPTRGYGYPQYNPEPSEPDTPSMWDLIGAAFDQALRPIIGDGYNKIDQELDFVDIATPYENNPNHQALMVACPVFIWERYIEPNAASIMPRLSLLGINSICLAA